MKKERFEVVVIACSLLFTGFLSTIVADAAGNSSDGGEPGLSMATREEGSIELSEGDRVSIGVNGPWWNRSHYIPVPAGATVTEANISVTNSPYSQDGKDYPRLPRIDVASGSDEYEFGFEGADFLEYWGRTNRTRNNEDRVSVDLIAQDTYYIPFVVPKNATVTSAMINVTGYQRTSDYVNYSAVGTSVTSYFGNVVRSIGDDSFDPDLYEDIIVTAPYKALEKGSIYKLYYGGPSTDQFYQSAEITGKKDFDQFGRSVSQGFDHPLINEVFAVGAPEYGLGNNGSVHILSHSTMSFLDDLVGNGTDEDFGAEVEAGDIDGDGEDELIVGAPTALSGRGKVYVFDLSGSGKRFSTYTYMKTVLNGSSGGANFGKTISLGDINGDSILDMAIGSDDNVTLYLGGNEVCSDPDKVFDPKSDTGVSSISDVEFVGDLIGSGYSSMIVGCSIRFGGKAAVYHGSSDPDVNSDGIISAPSTSEVYFADDIDGGHDKNGDGKPEFAIGASGDALNPGWVGIYSISSLSDPLEEFDTSNNQNLYGTSIEFGIDMRNDGYGDLVVGAPREIGVSDQRTGRVIIHEYFDSSSLPANTPIIEMDGSEVWRSGEEHLSSKVTTTDLSDQFNSQIEEAIPFASTPYDQYVIVLLEFSAVDGSSLERTSDYTLDGFEIIYDHTVNFPDLTEEFNRFLSNDDNSPVNGYVHVPMDFFSDESPGAFVLDQIDLTFDVVPVNTHTLEGISIPEDTSNPRLLDLHQYFSDDHTPVEELIFTARLIGDESYRGKANITNGHYLAVDVLNGTSNDNWTGVLDLEITVTDGIGGQLKVSDINITVTPVNDAPVVGDLPDPTVVQNANWNFIPSPEDAELDNVTVTLEYGPENMTVDELGTLSWTPNAWQVGVFNWSIRLSDGMDHSTYEGSTEVFNINDAPIFLSPRPDELNDRVVTVGESMVIDFDAYDLDEDDVITYRLVDPRPPGSTIDPVTGELTWIPPEHFREPQTFRIWAEDELGDHAEIVFNANTTYIDEPPVITSNSITGPPTDLSEWVYHFKAEDPESNFVVIELLEAPDGMTYNDVSENLTWTPRIDQIGEYTVSLKITSTSYVLYHNFTLEVERSERTWHIDLNTHSEGDTLKGKVTLRGNLSVEPGEVEYVEVKLGEGEWQNAKYSRETGVWSLTVDTSDLPEGEIVIQVRGWNGYSYSDPVSVKLNVRKEEETDSTILIIIIIAVVLAIAITALLGFIIYKRQKDKKEREEMEQQLRLIESEKEGVEKFLEEAETAAPSTDEEVQPTEPEVDQERMEQIDRIFSPTQTGEQPQQPPVQPTQETQEPVFEDPLQKADEFSLPGEEVKDESIPDIQEKPPIPGVPEVRSDTPHRKSGKENWGDD